MFPIDISKGSAASGNSAGTGRLTAVRPSDRQVAWQELEFTAFFHFGMNTFTNRSWGTGQEDPVIYNPARLDTGQWCEAILEAGIKACILTAKHHDGFCLWPTAYTSHSVMSSGKPADVVAMLADSCRGYGLKFGIYLSPWDRHERTYGQGAAYDDFFCGQLEELTTRYGELYTLWFDGACGEGPDGRVQVYDWDRYFAIIRKNQPNAVISSMGPDVRWIGNESGITRDSEWSVVSARLRDRTSIAASSQQEDAHKPLSPMEDDLGSRGALENEPTLCWYPAEVDVSIRPEWFYHPEENDKLRGVDDLLHIYETSVGGNAVLLLNIPPDTDGRVNENDAARLRELGSLLRSIYGGNLCAGAVATDGAGKDISHVLMDDDSFWRGDPQAAVVTIRFASKRSIRRVVLCEQIRQSQRIESFEIAMVSEGRRGPVFTGTTVGFKKICAFDPVEAESLEISITQSREWPTLRFVAVY